MQNLCLMGFHSNSLRMEKNYLWTTPNSAWPEFSTNPNYLFFDEPTKAMDPKSEKLFVEKCKLLIQQTMVVVTHRNQSSLTSRIIVIEQGQIVLDGQKNEVLKKLSA